MPIHDWTKVPSGVFHDFHQSWCVRIKDALNGGCLPEGTGAFVEQRTGPYETDVLAVEQSSLPLSLDEGGIATAAAPTTRIVRRLDREYYAEKGSRVVIKHHLGRLLAIIEVVSPGNKDKKSALRDFAAKTVQFLKSGVHVLVIDLFPPTSRDPQGIHKVIWDEFIEEEFIFPPGKDRILVSYETGRTEAAYIEPIAVGDELPAMPLFLTNSIHISVPLESTYNDTWNAAPKMMHDAVAKK